MFEDLMFPCTSLPPFSTWMRAMPLAAPKAILNRVSQSKGTFSSPLFPEILTKHNNKDMQLCNVYDVLI
jgi:hypothetical protein